MKIKIKLFFLLVGFLCMAVGAVNHIVFQPHSLCGGSYLHDNTPAVCLLLIGFIFLCIFGILESLDNEKVIK